ncbi:hypothetical protein SAZ_42295 [Streptomyces noursei ZPM]|nr:hypothetical protein SAZ_42295 [Streptomyces noursei ZPM]EPY92453.1 hypothetical protein K530_53270 [Streptomyces noursei CCRC 11814]
MIDAAPDRLRACTPSGTSDGQFVATQGGFDEDLVDAEALADGGPGELLSA